MRILFLTPGTGSYHCGVCMRDNALALELNRMGHDAVVVPMYMPLTLDEDAATPGVPIFFGGLNVYLQQRFSGVGELPTWVDRWISHPRLLRFLGKFSDVAGSGAELGELTLSMLRGEEGAQARELEKLVDWIAGAERPDVVWLSTGLLAGVVRRIQERVGVPVLCSLQGEDGFLNSLQEPHRSACWREMGERLGEIGPVVAPSRFFADRMERGLGLEGGLVRVISNGISLNGYPEQVDGSREPVVGFMARLCAEKGLDLVVEAFLDLCRRGSVPGVRLRCAGTMTSGDASYVRGLQKRASDAGFGDRVEFLPNISRERKIEFLSGLGVLSVPAMYGEAFGLYLLESMACGVPVVQPRSGGFSEIVEESGGGVIFEPFGAGPLADTWERVLLDPVCQREMGRLGRRAVETRFSMRAMAESFLKLSEDGIRSFRQTGGRRTQT